METLGIVLKKLRERKNISIIELAEKAGVGKGTVGDIETGRSKSTIKTLEKLSKALGLKEEERQELFSAFMPNDIGKKILDPRLVSLNKRELNQYEVTLSQASSFFGDEKVSEEDKKKLLDAMTEMFFIGKAKNKEKYAKNKTDKK